MMKYFLFACVLTLSGSIVHAQYGIQRAYPNLAPFSKPLAIAMPNDGTNRFFVAEQRGKIYSFLNSDTVSVKKVFLDLTDRVPQTGDETGLVGLTFHPRFAENGFLYITYTQYFDTVFKVFISRFSADPANPDTVLAGSEEVILTLTPPTNEHHAGTLAFGPDGYLYASIGDGGMLYDPLKIAQNPSSLFGKILRLDVNKYESSHYYGIPTDNPYIDSGATYKKEIYALGFRNPWKFSFDNATNSLWVGDVGQDFYEEVDLVHPGANYGWNILEGKHRFFNLPGDTTKLTLPVWEYPHENFNQCVTGGYVYRGTAMPSLVGEYIYGDYVSGRMWALDYSSPDTIINKMLYDGSNPRIMISSFGLDPNNEILVLDYLFGSIYRFPAPLGVVSTTVSRNPIALDRNYLDDRHTQTQAHITVSQSGRSSLALVDPAGREVTKYFDKMLTAGNYDFTISRFLNRCSNGIYFLRLNTSQGVFTQKILMMQ
ncbi:MAG: PQQ-dependent sugar dehydrogenase [Bacteroidota bacterium]|nr:PQQ-dependent sugar dehydrogenase [Bacteroidota bacterium]MDP4229518.1 PQQ-dependent sugar dehydrogenase [Bacteroidota bacterium]MDP4235861.1 PQQ-dependent sugar dehydrogenase [Bacteroidota bacterium]